LHIVDLLLRRVVRRREEQHRELLYSPRHLVGAIEEQGQCPNQGVWRLEIGTEKLRTRTR